MTKDKAQVAGAGAGAIVGGTIGSIFPGVGTVAGAALGSGLGGSIGGLFGESARAPDISGELAQIGALFAAQREAARQAINQSYQGMRGEVASNLAARGTYRSPVAENSFGKLNQSRLQAIGQSEGDLAGQEAQTRAKLLSQLLGYNVDAQQLKAQGQAAIYGQLGGIGSGLLFSRLNQAPIAPNMIPSSPAGSVPNYVMNRQWQGWNDPMSQPPVYHSLFNNLISDSPLMSTANSNGFR